MNNDNPELCIRCHKRPVHIYPNGSKAKVCSVCVLKALDTLFLDTELHFEKKCKTKPVDYLHCNCAKPHIIKLFKMDTYTIQNICLWCKKPVRNVVSRMPKLIVR